MEQQETNPFGKWLKEQCQADKLSLRQAAIKTGLSHATIADIIKGASPSPETIKRLARAFGSNGKRGLALEDKLLILAGYRSERPEGEDPSELMAELMERISAFTEPQLKLVLSFVNFISEMEDK